MLCLSTQLCSVSQLSCALSFFNRWHRPPSWHQNHYNWFHFIRFQSSWYNFALEISSNIVTYYQCIAKCIREKMRIRNGGLGIPIWCRHWNHSFYINSRSISFLCWNYRLRPPPFKQSHAWKLIFILLKCNPSTHARAPTRTLCFRPFMWAVHVIRMMCCSGYSLVLYVNVWATTQHTFEFPHERSKYVVTWLEHSRENNRPVPGPFSAELSIYNGICDFVLRHVAWCMYTITMPVPTVWYTHSWLIKEFNHVFIQS